VAAIERRLTDAGVRRLPGRARVQRSGAELVVDVRNAGVSRSLRADFVIGATGSVAVLPPGVAPDGTRVLLPRHLPGDAPPPQPVALLGAGPAGVELPTALAHLGVEAQLTSPSRQILPAFSETAARIVETALLEAGGRVRHNFRATGVRTVQDGVVIVAKDGSSLDAASVLLTRSSSLGPPQRRPNPARGQLHRSGCSAAPRRRSEVRPRRCQASPVWLLSRAPTEERGSPSPVSRHTPSGVR